MKVDKVERGVRWTAALGALAMTVVAISGQYRGTRRAKGRTSGEVPGIFKGYTTGALSFYLPVTVVSVTVLSLLWRPFASRLPTPLRYSAVIVGALLYFPGLALFIWGRKTMGEMYNISSSFRAELYADQRLITSGPFAYVRHPIYLGGGMVELGSILIYRTWATLLIGLASVLLPIRARREEVALAAEFGKEWEDYCRRVPAGIPFVGQ